jgi:hypothetical protein
LYWHFNQIYNAESDTWSQGAPIPEATWQATASATTGVRAPKRIYVMGGEGGFVEPLNQTFVYDPQPDTWSVGSSLPTALIDPAVAVVDDLVYVMGGGVAPYTSTAEVERYTPFLFGTQFPVSVISPENTTYLGSEIPLNFTLNEQVSWMGYSLDGQEMVTVDGNTTLSGLTVGSHNITVYATDTLGNTAASETVTFSVAAFPTTIIVALAVVAVAAVVIFVLPAYFASFKKKRSAT